MDHVNAYLEWANDISVEELETIVKNAITHDDKFPTIARLNALLREEKYNNYKKTTRHQIENCFICDGTGLVPALYKPNRVSTVPFIQMLSCKCSTGIIIEWTDSYFEKFSELQFKDRINGSFQNYAQIVDQVKREKIRGRTR